MTHIHVSLRLKQNDVLHIHTGTFAFIGVVCVVLVNLQISTTGKEITYIYFYLKVINVCRGKTFLDLRQTPDHKEMTLRHFAFVVCNFYVF